MARPLVHPQKTAFNRLREYREAAGLSQAQLAAKAKVEPRTIFSIEKRQIISRPSTKRKILKALGMTMRDQDCVWPRT